MKGIQAAIIVALVVPTAVSAEGVGTITADFGGETKEWHIISVTRGNETAISAGYRDHRLLPTLSLQGHPEPRFTVNDVLSISGRWFGGYDESKPISGVEIIFMPNGLSNPFYTSDQVPGDPVMTLERFEKDGEAGHATGVFSGKVCLVPEMYAEPDMSDCKDISGSFDTPLRID
ncbi:hypothetical protein [Pukyongiella litopenaei]|uniref:Uncharacterized protein n=1 Tax=Pukyongiella litopenaei TaxID=2605946 RepID=A0A5C2H1J4_9RHOB|nr:hypothetical protein [Pukyongiella litopenaei]QEP30327.1 hypothetical protein C6Y53_19040 [Pukyongiella litopenaei]